LRRFNLVVIGVCLVLMMVSVVGISISNDAIAKAQETQRLAAPKSDLSWIYDPARMRWETKYLQLYRKEVAEITCADEDEVLKVMQEIGAGRSYGKILQDIMYDGTFSETVLARFDGPRRCLVTS